MNRNMYVYVHNIDQKALYFLPKLICNVFLVIWKASVYIILLYRLLFTLIVMDPLNFNSRAITDGYNIRHTIYNNTCMCYCEE